MPLVEHVRQNNIQLGDQPLKLQLDMGLDTKTKTRRTNTHGLLFNSIRISLSVIINAYRHNTRILDARVMDSIDTEVRSNHLSHCSSAG